MTVFSTLNHKNVIDLKKEKNQIQSNIWHGRFNAPQCWLVPKHVTSRAPFQNNCPYVGGNLNQPNPFFVQKCFDWIKRSSWNFKHMKTKIQRDGDTLYATVSDGKHQKPETKSLNRCDNVICLHFHWTSRGMFVRVIVRHRLCAWVGRVLASGRGNDVPRRKPSGLKLQAP